MVHIWVPNVLTNFTSAASIIWFKLTMCILSWDFMLCKSPNSFPQNWHLKARTPVWMILWRCNFWSSLKPEIKRLFNSHHSFSFLLAEETFTRKQIKPRGTVMIQLTDLSGIQICTLRLTLTCFRTSTLNFNSDVWAQIQF